MKNQGLGEPLAPSDIWDSPESFDPTNFIPDTEKGGDPNETSGGTPTETSTPKKKRNGFFGFLFKNLFTIVGAASTVVVGPIGLGLGRRIDNARKKANLPENSESGNGWFHYFIGLGISLRTINNVEQLNSMTASEVEQVTNITGVESYPMSDPEYKKIAKWLGELFEPTINKLTDKIDNTIALTEKNTSGALKTQLIISKTNEVLKDIATFRAYNRMILKYGERSYVLVNSSNQQISENYSKNKVNFTEFYLTILEKTILQYVESTSKIEGVKLIKSEFVASDITTVGLVSFDWQNKNIISESKKYVSINDPAYYNTIEITDINTAENYYSATNGIGENVAEHPSKTPFIFKALAVAGLVYLGKNVLK